MKLKKYFITTLVFSMIILFASDIKEVKASDTIQEDNTIDYVVTYHINGGDFYEDDTVTEITVNNGVDYKLITDLDKIGYTFSGWYSDEMFTEEIIMIPVGNTDSIEVYAKWVPIEYSISYNTTGYEVMLPEDVPKSYNIESDEVVLPELESFGDYTFIGWHINSNLSDVAVTKINKGAVGDLILYPEFVYNVQDFTVDGVNYSLELGGACVQKSNFKGEVIIPEIVEYKEKSYNVVSVADNAFEQADEVTNVVLPSNIDHLEYGTFLDCVTLAQLTVYSRLVNIIDAVPISTNIKCFYDSVADEEFVNGGFTGELLYFTVHLKYELNGGKLSKDFDEYVVGDGLSLSEPIKEGFTFLGWYRDAEFSENGYLGDFLFDDSVVEDITIYAKWVRSIYSIQYELNGGVNNNANPATYVYRIGVTLQNPTRVGYRFDGWFEDSSFTKKVKRITTVAQKDYLLYAKWTALAAINNSNNSESVYKITYNLSGGINSPNNPDSFNGAKVIELKKPIKKGYKFLYWCTDKEMTNKITKIAAGTKTDVTLYAKWSKITIKKGNLKSVQNKKGKKIYVQFGKLSGVDGYQLQYCTSKNFSKKKTKVVTLSKKKSTYTIKKLKRGKQYYVRICGYKLDSAGEKVYGKWSSKNKIRVIK